MKKIILIFALFQFLLANIAYSQTEGFRFNDKEFNSVFANIKSGKYAGTANGVLIFKNSEGKRVILDFQGSQCNLMLEEDENEVYDVSTKIYIAQTTSGKTNIKYKTYGLGNELHIEYQGQFYNVGLLDGACDMVIDDLSYTYLAEKETEYLILTIKKELKLSNYWYLLDEAMKVYEKNHVQEEITDPQKYVEWVNARNADIESHVIPEVIKKEQFIFLQPKSVLVFAIKRK